MRTSDTYHTRASTFALAGLLFVIALVGLLLAYSAATQPTAAADGSAGGLTAIRNQFWHQYVPGLGSVAHEDGNFGFALASGDFNGDGADDLAAGVVGQQISDEFRAGAVTIIYGSGTGLTESGTQEWHQDSPGIEGTVDAFDGFGFALASGDFNGDGTDDLAVGAPAEDVGDHPNAGTVTILYGSPAGLAAEGNQVWHQDSPGVEGDAEEEDHFGHALATGDFNGDGMSDLAVGVFREDIGGFNLTSGDGAVNILYGSPDGLTASGNQQWHQDSPGIEDDAHTGDLFGDALSSGDFNGDGMDDLAVGVPGETIANTTSGGAVNVLYGSASGLSASGNQLWHQSSPGTPGAANAGDGFGSALATGDFDGDGVDDLAVGAPGEDIDGTFNAGAVNVLFGSSAGLTAEGSEVWHQDSPGIEDTAEAFDQFAFALASGDFDGDAFDDLAVGIPAEDIADPLPPAAVVNGLMNLANVGAVAVIHGSSSGLTATGNQLWHQNSPGMEDMAEALDVFGAPLTSGDYDGDGVADLAAAVPEEDLASPGGDAPDVDNAGAAHVLYGSIEAPAPTPTATKTAGLTPTPEGRNVGDANGDGSIDSIDAALILQEEAGLISSVPHPEVADVNEDGVINAVDAALILQFTAGLLGSLPP